MTPLSSPNRSNSISSALNAPTGDSQTPTAENQQFSSISQRQQRSGSADSAPQKPFQFGDLGAGLKIYYTKFQNMLNSNLAGWTTYDDAKTSLASEQAANQIKSMPINNINDLNAALQVAENINVDFRHEPMQAIADRLIFLSREDSQAGKNTFVQKATPFIREGNKLDQAIKFFDWSRSITTLDQPNLPDSLIEKRRHLITHDMTKRIITARQEVTRTIIDDGNVNTHDMDLLVQHARGLELNGPPNLPESAMSSLHNEIEESMRIGRTAMEALEYVKKDFRFSSHDIDLLEKYARGLEVNGLPNLSARMVGDRQSRIESEIRDDRTAEEAVESVLNKDVKVNTHDMDLFVQYAKDFAMTHVPFLLRSKPISSALNAPMGDSQPLSGNAVSRASSPPTVSTAADQQFSSISKRQQRSGPNDSAPQKHFPFSDLPAELQISVTKYLQSRDRLNFARAGSVTYAAAKTSLASEQAAHQIKSMPINNLNDLNAALQVAENINAAFRHEPMQAVAEKLIFLPHQDSQAGKKAFVQKATPFIREGNKLDQAIKFFDWSKSITTSEQPNLPFDLILDRQKEIEYCIKDRRPERETVEYVVRKYGTVNRHDMDLLVQYARGLEVKGPPNLSDREVSDYQKFIALRMRHRLSAMETVEFLVNNVREVNRHDMDLLVQYAKGLEVNGLPNLSESAMSSLHNKIEESMRIGKTAMEALNHVKKDFRFNSHDIDLLEKYARGLEVNGLPNLSNDSISSSCQRSIEWKMREGLTAREAVEFVVNRYCKVNSHDMGLFLQHAENFRP